MLVLDVGDEGRVGGFVGVGVGVGDSGEFHSNRILRDYTLEEGVLRYYS